MFRVFNCLTDAHDWRLVVLAAAVCLLASISAVNLFQRARATRRRARLVWILMTGAATGCGIWATHFIAMLAYDPGIAVAYDIALTALSLLAAVAITSAGVTFTLYGHGRFTASIGGGIIGGGIAAMHYLGMWALEVPGRVTWSPDLVAASIVLGVLFGASALELAVRRDDVRGTLAAAALLTLAIISHHFTAMGAVAIVPDPAGGIDAMSFSNNALALAVAGTTIAILGMCLVGAIADRRSQGLVRAQKRKLDVALNNMNQGLVMFDSTARVVVSNQRYLEMYRLAPDQVRPGRTLRDLLELRAAVGTFSGDPEKYIPDLLREIAKGKPFRRTVELTDGRVIALLNQPMQDGGWVVTHEDITERHQLLLAREQTEAQLREQKMRLDTALNNMTQGLNMFDSAGRLVVCNERYLQMYRLSPDVVKPGCTMEDLVKYRIAAGTFFAADPAKYAFDLLGSMNNRQPTSTTLELDDGRVITVTSQPTASGDGWVVTHEDITERHRLLRAQAQAEKDLLEHHLRLDAALNNMNQGLIMFDASARLVVCNDRYLQLYGLSPEIIRPGCTVRQLLEHRAATGTFSGAVGKYVIDLLASIAEKKTSRLTVELKDGRFIDVVNQPMAGGGWVATHEDITERRKAEKERDHSKAFLDLVIENVPVTIAVKDASDFRYVLINKAAEKYYGIPREQIIGKKAHEVLPKASADLVTKLDKKLLESYQGPVQDEHVIEVAGQVTRVAMSTRLLIFDDTGKPQYLLALVNDITERKRAEDEVRRTREFLNTVIENVPVTLIVKEARERRYVLINRAAEEFFGIPREEMIGKTAHDFFPQDEADIIAARDEEVLRSGNHLIVEEHPIKTPRRGVCLVSIKRLAILGDDGEPQYMLGVIEDFTERKRVEAKIAHMAHHDALTGLPNRAAFIETVTSTVNQAAAAGESFAVLSIDLDGFKEVNDQFGHSTGDAVLRELAARFQMTAEGAFVARVGGDEFTLISTTGPQPSTAEALAARLVADLAEDIQIEGKQIRVGLNIGVAVYPADGHDVATLLASADAALGWAMADGRGSIRFFESGMDKRLRERRALQQDLRTAVERGELVLYYQPQAKVDGEIIGFEALARWHHPTRGIVPPGTFIPVAEESGLIVTIGEWILREACREAASWPRPLQIAINLSPVQFQHGDLPGLVHAILFETGLDARRLELEITEGVLIGDHSRALTILRRLKLLGVHIAMDDFGTGYSSLSYLQSFPFDKIKIDQSFISNLEKNPQSAAIVRAVIGLGRGLDLPVLAEGVETDAQLIYLAREACAEVQGYLVGRPRPISDYAEMVGRPASAGQILAAAG